MITFADQIVCLHPTTLGLCVGTRVTVSIVDMVGNTIAHYVGTVQNVDGNDIYIRTHGYIAQLRADYIMQVTLTARGIFLKLIVACQCGV